MHLSDRARALQESAIRKLDLGVARQTGVKFHRLNIGQPDIFTPREILEALAADDGPVLAYGPASGLPECREAAAHFHKVTRDDVVVTQGGSEAILFALIALCDPGDEVIVPEPYYTNYNGFSTVAGTKVIPVRTTLDDGFALPSDDALDEVVTPRTRAIMFSNPGNPTGAVYDEASLRRVAAWANKRGLWLISDEVYHHIWFKKPPFSALQLASDNVIVVDSMSKTFSACGLRIGFLISRNQEFMEKIERLGQARLGPQPRAQRAAIKGLQLPKSYIEEVRATYKRRVDVMMDSLAQIADVTFHRPEGAFYSMVRLPVKDTEQFARFLATEFRENGESVVVAPGPGFYADPKDGRDEVRLAAVHDERVLARAIEVLGKGIVAWSKRAPSGAS